MKVNYDEELELELFKVTDLFVPDTGGDTLGLPILPKEFIRVKNIFDHMMEISLLIWDN